MIPIVWSWILLGFLALIALLLLLPLSARIGYDGDVTLSAGALGIYLRILPKKRKTVRLGRFSPKNYQKLLDAERRKEEKKLLAASKKAEKKRSADEAAKRDRDKRLPPAEVSDEPSMIRVLIGIAGEVLGRFFGRLRVKVLRLHITVGGSDASKTALTYGFVSQGVAYLLELIRQKTKASPVRAASVSVTPDFLAAKTTADVEIRFSLRLIDLIAVGISALLLFLKEKSAGTPRVSRHNEVQK